MAYPCRSSPDWQFCYPDGKLPGPDAQTKQQSTGPVVVGVCCQLPRPALRGAQGNMAMLEINYEKEYDNRARVSEHPQIFARWATDAESYRASLSGPQVERVNYGPTTREVIDL